jgi:CBS domain containing-hemolysin-like protein
MNFPFAVLPGLPLQPRSSFGRQTKPLEIIHLDSPALAVMTDFKTVYPVTVHPDVAIDDALRKMKTAGVRLLFVMNDADEVIGLVTAKDIMGERPITIIEQKRVPRSAVTVAAIMTPQPDIQVLDIARVRRAQVGDIVETLRTLERQHALVAEIDAATGAQRVVGMFSTSQISKLLDRDVTEDLHPAHSLAEIVEKIS